MLNMNYATAMTTEWRQRRSSREKRGEDDDPGSTWDAVGLSIDQLLRVRQ